VAKVKRTPTVAVALDQSQKDMVKAIAKRKGMKMAHYIRLVLFAAMEKEAVA
jgi:antitoxin component of RelBE/YafQ-DinJ toxin-antitoxin module